MNTIDTLRVIISHLQSQWNSSEGASATIRKGPHTRRVTIDKGNRQDLWIWSGRVRLDGSTALLGRIDCRELDNNLHGIPDLSGWNLDSRG